MKKVQMCKSTGGSVEEEPSSPGRTKNWGELTGAPGWQESLARHPEVLHSADTEVAVYEGGPLARKGVAPSLT